MPKTRKNNSGSYQNRNGRHIIQWSLNGKRKTKSFKSEKAALAFLESVAKCHTLLKISEYFNKWIENRPNTPSNYGYKVRFAKHWAPIIGHLAPGDLNIPILKESIGIFKKNGLSKATVGLNFRILSSFLSELVENGIIQQNYVSQLSSKTKKEFKSIKDPAKIPFIKNIQDISRIYTWMNGISKSASLAFAIGALAGLRLNEIRALSWEDIDFDQHLIHVRWQAGSSQDGEDRLRAPKNKTERMVPISNDLYIILQKWFEQTQGNGWLIRPTFSNDKNKKFIGKNHLTGLLKRALKVLKINKLNWYAGTRHTFATHYIMGGGNMGKLKEILGHSSIQTTERFYLHLIPGKYSEEDRNIIKVELKNYEKPQDWKLKEIDSKIRGDLLPSDGHWNERDSRPNGE
jgi:integrase